MQETRYLCQHSKGTRLHTSFYHGMVARSGRLGTAWAPGMPEGSIPDAPGVRGVAPWGAAWSKALAHAAAPRLRCRAASAIARDHGRDRVHGRDLDPSLDRGPDRGHGRALGPSRARSGCGLCTSNRPASGSYP